MQSNHPMPPKTLHDRVWDAVEGGCFSGVQLLLLHLAEGRFPATDSQRYIRVDTGLGDVYLMQETNWIGWMQYEARMHSRLFYVFPRSTEPHNYLQLRRGLSDLHWLWTNHRLLAYTCKNKSDVLIDMDRARTILLDELDLVAVRILEVAKHLPTRELPEMVAAWAADVVPSVMCIESIR